MLQLSVEETAAPVERANVQSFERLMCEVEFWEVFLEKVLGFFEWCPKVPLVDCRIVNLDWANMPNNAD
jgi:hypothetical protein